MDFPRNLGKNFPKSVGDARSTSSCSGGILIISLLNILDRREWIARINPERKDIAMILIHKYIFAIVTRRNTRNVGSIDSRS